MASEKTYLDRLQRCREFRAEVARLDPPYAPSDDLFTLANLDAKIQAANDANNLRDDTEMDYSDLVNDRQLLVRSIGPLVTQVLAHVRSNTAWKRSYEAVKKAADKVRGVRKPSKPATKLADGEEPAEKQKKREQGERSYSEIQNQLLRFVKRIAKLTGYDPPDPKIKLDALQQLHADVKDLNDRHPDVEQAFSDAIRARREAYLSVDEGAEGLKFVFDGVKTSVKGQYGQQSPQYRSISPIRW